MQETKRSQSIISFIKKREDVRIKYLNNPNTFIEYSNTMDDVYENINDHKQKEIKKF